MSADRLSFDYIVNGGFSLSLCLREDQHLGGKVV